MINEQQLWIIGGFKHLKHRCLNPAVINRDRKLTGRHDRERVLCISKCCHGGTSADSKTNEQVAGRNIIHRA